MHIINDFFLLIWGERLEQHAALEPNTKATFDRILADTFEYFCDGAVILLMVNPHNFDNMARLEEPKTVLNTLFNQTSFEKTTIQYAQAQLLGYLIALGNLPINHAILKRLEHLKKRVFSPTMRCAL